MWQLTELHALKAYFGRSRQALDLGKRGAKGTRTPGLLHAMQALYQLSYSPSAVTSVRRQRHASVQDLAVSAVVAEHRLGQGAGVVLDEAPPPTPAAQDRPGAVREGANHAPEFLGQA